MDLLAPEHVAALALTALLCALAAWLPRARPGGWVVVASRALAVAIAVAFAADHVAAAVQDEWSLDRYLPLHLSDVATVVAVVALWTARPLLAELTYFWGLTASLQATVTPDLGHGFPAVLFFTFFVTHAGVVVAAVLLVAGRRMAPRPGAVRRAFAATLAVAVAAAVGDLATGGNYMFLRHKPSGSLLDVMGPWPWYIATTAVLAGLMFAVLDAAARRGRRRRSRPTRSRRPPAAGEQQR